MVDQYKTYTICNRCLGIGVYFGSSENDVTENPCKSCLGEKYIVIGSVNGATEIDFIKKKIKVILNHLGLPEE